MRRFGGPGSPAMNGLALAFAILGLVAACSSSSSTVKSAPMDAGQSPDVTKAVTSLGDGDWAGALASCLSAETASPGDCDARYCELIARSMMVVDEINTFLLPRYRRPLTPMPGDVENLATTNMLLDQAIASAETVTGRNCEFDLPKLPLKMGDPGDLISRR